MSAAEVVAYGSQKQGNTRIAAEEVDYRHYLSEFTVVLVVVLFSAEQFS